MTRSDSKLLDQLIGLAGNAEIVHQALVELNQRSDRPPTLEEIIRRILELKEEASATAA
jgi:hypothetical protein